MCWEQGYTQGVRVCKCEQGARQRRSMLYIACRQTGPHVNSGWQLRWTVELMVVATVELMVVATVGLMVVATVEIMVNGCGNGRVNG